MLFITSILTFLALFAPRIFALVIADPTRPASGTVDVTTLEVDLEGSGCKPGEVHVAIASDNSALTIIFDKFEAADGPLKGSAKTRAFCRVTIGTSAPGWAFDIASVDFRGYVNIDKDVDVSLVSRWKWVDTNGNDLKGKGNVQKKLSGPLTTDILLHKDGELSSNEAAVCQKKDARVQISLSATVKSSSSTANGLVVGSSQDVGFGFGQKLNLAWKKC